MGRYFPLFVDLSDKNVLVVGGGTIAARRAGVIRPFAGQLTVVAPEIGEGLAAVIEEAGDRAKEGAAAAKEAGGSVTVRQRAFREDDLDTAQLVLVCTDDHKLNYRITALCRERGIPVNNASDKQDCDFFFPGIVDRDPVVVGITASGQAHALAKTMREKIGDVVEETLRGMAAEDLQ